MASPFDNMSDEDILKFVREASKEPGAQPVEAKPAEQKFSVNIGGETIEAANADELNRRVQAKIEEAVRAARPAEPARPESPSPAPPKFDMKKFTEVFVEDPDAGLEYLEMAKYGMPVRKAVPQMLAVTAALVQKVQELENASFAPKEDADRRAVEQIMRERNWQPSRQAFEDAMLIAKGRGLIGNKKEEKPAAEERPAFIPPRIPRVAPEDAEATDAEIARAAQTMPLDKLEDLLIAKGVIKTRRVS